MLSKIPRGFLLAKIEVCIQANSIIFTPGEASLVAERPFQAGRAIPSPPRNRIIAFSRLFRYPKASLYVDSEDDPDGTP